jgi:hypothetical protein
MALEHRHMTRPAVHASDPALDTRVPTRKPDDARVPAAQRPERDPGIAELRSRVASLASDCGCSMGGIFLAAALTGAAIYFLIAGGLGLSSGLLALAFVFAASVIGKLVGLAVARIRMLRLRRMLAARLASLEGSHVHLH